MNGRNWAFVITGCIACLMLGIFSGGFLWSRSSNSRALAAASARLERNIDETRAGADEIEELVDIIAGTAGNIDTDVVRITNAVSNIRRGFEGGGITLANLRKTVDEAYQTSRELTESVERARGNNRRAIQIAQRLQTDSVCGDDAVELEAKDGLDNWRDFDWVGGCVGCGGRFVRY